MLTKLSAVGAAPTAGALAAAAAGVVAPLAAGSYFQSSIQRNEYRDQGLLQTFARSSALSSIGLGGGLSEAFNPLGAAAGVVGAAAGAVGIYGVRHTGRSVKHLGQRGAAKLTGRAAPPAPARAPGALPAFKPFQTIAVHKPATPLGPTVMKSPTLPVPVHLPGPQLKSIPFRHGPTAAPTPIPKRSLTPQAVQRVGRATSINGVPVSSVKKLNNNRHPFASKKDVRNRKLKSKATNWFNNRAMDTARHGLPIGGALAVGAMTAGAVTSWGEKLARRMMQEGAAVRRASGSVTEPTRRVVRGRTTSSRTVRQAAPAWDGSAVFDLHRTGGAGGVRR